MLEKTRTVVNICGREYAMAGVESEEYIHRVAIYVDKKMNEFKNHYVNLSPTDLAVLTALNIADEYLKLKYDHSGAAEEISELKEELKKAKIENALLKEEKKDKVMSMKKESGNKLFDSYK
jgi:cell division protein ZapA